MSSLKITMLELQLKKSSFFWWILSWSILAIFFISAYDTVASDQTLSQDFINQIPPELAKSFNIGQNYLSQIESFISGQFLTLYSLIGGIFLTTAGVNAISGKIQSGQITEYIFNPYTRFQTLLGVYFANLSFIFIANFVVTLTLFLSANLLTKQSEISSQYFIFFYLGNILLQFFFFNLGLVLGLFLPQTKQIGIAIGLVVASWFINNILNLADFPKFLRLISPFYYFDLNLLATDFVLNWTSTAVLLIGSVVCFCLASFRWAKIDVEV